MPHNAMKLLCSHWWKEMNATFFGLPEFSNNYFPIVDKKSHNFTEVMEIKKVSFAVPWCYSKLRTKWLTISPKFHSGWQSVHSQRVMNKMIVFVMKESPRKNVLSFIWFQRLPLANNNNGNAINLAITKQLQGS